MVTNNWIVLNYGFPNLRKLAGLDWNDGVLGKLLDKTHTFFELGLVLEIESKDTLSQIRSVQCLVQSLTLL